MGKNFKQVVSLTRQQIKGRVAVAVILFLACLAIAFPAKINAGVNWINNKTNLGFPTLPSSGFSLGLDLQGGAHLIYEADTAQIKDSDKVDSVEGVRDVIERRVRGGLGVAEPVVQTTRVGESYRIIVELPGVTDVNQAISMIGETPVLEFKEENTEPQRELTKEEEKQMNDYNKTANKKVKEALNMAKSNSDFNAVVSKYSEDETSKNNGGSVGFIDGNILKDIYDWAVKAKDGDVSPSILKSPDGLNVAKRISQKNGDKLVSASHLLLCYKGASGCDNPQYTKQEAKAKIDEIKAQATTQNFADLVKQYSTEPGAKERAGDLGKFGKGQMVPEFEKVAFEMASGAISDVVETQFGYHLIYKKSEEASQLVEVARVLVRTKTAADIVPPADEWKATGLSGKQLERAEVVENQQTGQIQVSLKFNSEGTDLFADITQRNVGKPVAIFLDGSPISIPKVNEAILSGDAVITGGFTLIEAKQLAQRLNSGALPVPVELISQQSVGATLGLDSLNKSLKAGIVGFIAVILFMIAYYRFAGFVAVFALALYAALSLAIFKLANVTLTLSGVAGFILSVGMAVDANVLIFERLKEELRLKKSLRTAMEESFTRAWPSIRDSNITTLISCVFLIWLGGGFVQGFAVTLSIGVLVSMFTAITITRNLLRFTLPLFKEEGNMLFYGYQKREENKQ
jgi:protein-export membrane protein SecD